MKVNLTRKEKILIGKVIKNKKEEDIRILSGMVEIPLGDNCKYITIEQYKKIKEKVSSFRSSPNQ